MCVYNIHNIYIIIYTYYIVQYILDITLRCIKQEPVKLIV